MAALEMVFQCEPVLIKDDATETIVSWRNQYNVFRPRFASRSGTKPGDCSVKNSPESPIRQYSMFGPKTRGGEIKKTLSEKGGTYMNNAGPNDPFIDLLFAHE
jgi:hypothetical protein